MIKNEKLQKQNTFDAKNNNKKSDLFLIISIVLFLFSLVLPAYVAHIDKHYDIRFGVEPFMLGIFSLNISWYANPLMFIAWYTRRSNQGKAIICSFFALPIALIFCLNSEVPIGSAGDYSFSLDYGYYVWVASIAMSFCASWIYEVSPGNLNSEKPV